MTVIKWLDLKDLCKEFWVPKFIQCIHVAQWYCSMEHSIGGNDLAPIHISLTF